MDLPIENGGSFHNYVNVYQRVSIPTEFLDKNDTLRTSLASSLFCCRVKIHKPAPLVPVPVRHPASPADSLGAPPHRAPVTVCVGDGLKFGNPKLVTDALWLCNIAMENCRFIDGLPIKNGDFPWLCEITRW